jgi:hypothetical protein
MTKKQLYKLKPGTLIKIKWDDMPEPTLGMLLERISRDSLGDVSIHVYHFDTEIADHHAIHSQIVEVLYRLTQDDGYLVVGQNLDSHYKP